MRAEDLDHLASSGCSICRDIARRELELKIQTSGRGVRMSKDTADKAIEEMRKNYTLYFSQRFAIEQLFDENCREHELAVCVSNFLSWLITADLGQDVIVALVAEAGKRR